MSDIAESTYQLDELRFYIVELELHSIMWFSTLTQPHLDAFVQTQVPVVHNYPLLLALEGHIVEESYISKYNEYKNIGFPASRFKHTGIYAYPMRLERVYYKKLLLSMAETDYVFYKPKTRLAVPLITHYNVLAPGTRGKTVVVTLTDMVLPKEGLFVRLGAKRYGVWKTIGVQEAQVRLVNRLSRVVSPFNVEDISRETLAGAPIIVLKHYAGDIAIAGTFSKALEIRMGRELSLKPIPFFITP